MPMIELQYHFMLVVVANCRIVFLTPSQVTFIFVKLLQLYWWNIYPNNYSFSIKNSEDYAKLSALLRAYGGG